MEYSQMRTWAECSEEALTGNIKAVKEIIGGCKLLCVIKANAYGHGAVRAAEIISREGADYLGVSTLAEGIELRQAGITTPILIMCGTPSESTDELIHYDLTQTVTDLIMAKEYAKEAAAAGKSLKCHIKYDSGMGRQGFKSIDDIVSSMELRGLHFEGAYSHFAVSDEDSPNAGTYTKMQFDKFISCIDELKKKGKKFDILHTANSGAVINHPYTYLDMVRPGLLLYGYTPGGETVEGLSPVMELKTRIVQIKSLSRGESISYGRRFTAAGDMKIAVLPIGYADGLSRSLGGKLAVSLEGDEAAPQVGSICMDMCMIDITHSKNVKVGDVVTIFGREKGFTAQDVADIRKTLSYEVLCNVSGRVPRVWK